MIPEGYYDGKILAARIDAEPDTDDLVLVWSVKVGDGETVDCRHRTTGDYAHVTREVAEHLDIEWPYGIERIDETVGRDVRVRIKHNTSSKYCNAYIVTRNRRGTPAVASQIRSKLHDLARAANVAIQADDDDGSIPF